MLFYISIRQIAIVYWRLFMDKYYQDPELLNALDETKKKKCIIDKELEKKLIISRKYRLFVILLYMLRILLIILIALTIISLFLSN